MTEKDDDLFDDLLDLEDDLELSDNRLVPKGNLKKESKKESGLFSELDSIKADLKKEDRVLFEKQEDTSQSTDRLIDSSPSSNHTGSLSVKNKKRTTVSKNKSSDLFDELDSIEVDLNKEDRVLFASQEPQSRTIQSPDKNEDTHTQISPKSNINKSPKEKDLFSDLGDLELEEDIPLELEPEVVEQPKIEIYSNEDDDLFSDLDGPAEEHEISPPTEQKDESKSEDESDLFSDLDDLSLDD